MNEPNYHSFCDNCKSLLPNKHFDCLRIQKDKLIEKIDKLQVGGGILTSTHLTFLLSGFNQAKEQILNLIKQEDK